MAPSCYDVAASMLLCAEDNSSILWMEEEEADLAEVSGRKRGRSSPDWDGDGDGFGADLFPPQSEECVADLLEREQDHMPRHDYGDRLRRGGVDLRVRWEAVDWISKVHAYCSFGPHTACLAVSYLDRFLSQYELPEGKAWMTQLLSVACLSLAAKMEETAVPQSLDLQVVGNAHYMFEAKTIQRMELLVLSTLDWRMQVVTPFSYLDYFLQKLNGGDAAPRSWLCRSTELILCATKGTGCIGFRPSEVAAAVAAAVVGDVGAVRDIVKACTHAIDMDRVSQCQDAIQSSINTVLPKPAGGGRASSPAPQSPVGVLDAAAAACTSYKSSVNEDAAAAVTVASHGAAYGGSASAASSSSVTSKRRKISR